MPLIRKLIQGVGSGIGLASEAIADRKEKKTAEKHGRGLSPNPQTRGGSPSPQGRGVSPRPYGESSRAYSSDGKKKPIDDSDESSSTDEEDLDTDNAEWALDDAANELSSPPLYEEVGSDSSDSPNDYAKSFLNSHRMVVPSQGYRPLPDPVILPQRRPKDKSRGFVRAYAPSLGKYSGVDQTTFIDFLNNFDQASKASHVFDVINLACFAVGFIPNPIAMAVSTAVQIANRTAQELQSRHRRNTYLDQINESFFKPRGLFCMIMTFKPDNPYNSVIGMDINPHDQALAKTLSTPDSELRQKLKSIRLTSGTTQGEISLPEAAPLIYPALDAAADKVMDGNPPDLPEQKQNKLKASGAFVASYLDRRAQATYAGTNPQSKLAVPPSDKKFASRYSDPNHPANSGTLLGLLTGGNFDPKAKKRVRRAERTARRKGQAPLTEEDKKNIMLGRNPRKRKTMVGRVLQKDVLYLAIVNLPSESEMREIMQEMERVKSKQ